MFSSADSLRPVSAGFSSFFGSGLDGSAGGVSAALGLPSGKAVLNLPLSRTASAYSVPDLLKSWINFSPVNCAIIGSTSCEFFEDLISDDIVSPSVGVPVKVPPKT